MLSPIRRGPRIVVFSNRCATCYATDDAGYVFCNSDYKIVLTWWLYFIVLSVISVDNVGHLNGIGQGSFYICYNIQLVLGDVLHISQTSSVW